MKNKKSPTKGRQKSVSPRARDEKTPSVRQRLYVRGVIAGKTKKRAARDAGYAKSTASNVKGKIESKKAVQQLFSELLERAGVSDKLLAKRIKEGLSATVVSKSTANAFREVLVDYGERREMAELAIRMKGLQPAEKIEHKVTLEDLLAETHE